MTKMFGTDGIRGHVGEWPLVPEFCLRLGRVAGEILKAEMGSLTLVVGRDPRRSGQMLMEALAAGLLASGAEVIDVGVIPTPGVSWLLKEIGADAGVVISASHNPVEQNGIKFFSRSGYKLSEEIEATIEEALLAEGETQNNPRLGEEAGRLVDGQYLQERYIRGLLLEQEGLSLKNLKVVVDCANGAASYYAPEVFGRLGAQVVAIHASPNGWNINVDAGSEHVRRHMEDIRVLIKQHQANFGLAFDGDADRVIFVDENGDLVDGDHMLGILAGYLDTQNRLMARSVVTTNMRNQGLKTYLERLGITLYETPVGDKYVVEKLRQIRSRERKGVGLGGEQSGHIILDDAEHATGDGIRTALYVIQAYLDSGIASFSGYSESIGKVPQLIASAYVGHGQRLDRAELDRVESHSLVENAGLLRINLRYSGTEPLFRVMLESDGKLSVEDLSALATNLCHMAQRAAGIGNSTIDILNCTTGGVVSIT